MHNIFKLFGAPVSLGGCNLFEETKTGSASGSSESTEVLESFEVLESLAVLESAELDSSPLRTAR